MHRRVQDLVSMATHSCYSLKGQTFLKDISYLMILNVLSDPTINTSRSVFSGQNLSFTFYREKSPFALKISGKQKKMPK